MDGGAAAGEEAEEEYAEADVLGELQEREDQLRQAAELGQSLLQRTEDLQLANEQLAAEARVANEVVEETEYRVHELTSESARLHALLEAKEAALEEKEEELRAALEEREQAEPSAIGRALDAVGEAASAERTAQAEAELRTLRQEVGELQERQAEAQHAWDQEGAGRRAAERKHKKVAAELAATQEELRERSEAASEAQRAGAEQQAAAQAERARVKDLTVRLASMEAEVARVKNRVGPEPAAAGLGLRLQEREGAASSEASKEAFDWLSLLRVCCARLKLEADVELPALAAMLAVAERSEELLGDAEANCRKLCTNARLASMRSRRRKIGTADFVESLERLKR